MKPGLFRTFALLAALILGTLLPQAHAASPAVRWLVMSMLLTVFLQTRFSRDALQRSHAWLLVANLAMGFVGWALGWIVGGREVAQAAFFAGITPTAAAAPVVTGFLRGRVDYVVAAFFITTLTVALLMPGLLPFMLGRATPDLVTHVLGSVGLVVFVPLAVALTLRKIYPPAEAWPKRLSNVSFGTWVVTLFIVTAGASHFLRTQPGLPFTKVIEIAGTTAAVCAANFALGRWIGRQDFPREASQSLGQKNTSLTIFMALTYASPLVALGPTCYVLWHNLWNSWQLHRVYKKEHPKS